MRTGAIFVLLAGRVHPADWTQARNAHPQPKANITKDKNACRVHTKMRRARHRVNHALLENTEKIAPSSILLKQTAASTARRVNTVVPMASRLRAGVTLALLEDRVKRRAWIRAINARPQPKANITTDKNACRVHTKIKLGRHLASLAQLESMG